jgi:hypothetical protein
VEEPVAALGEVTSAAEGEGTVEGTAEKARAEEARAAEARAVEARQAEPAAA